MVDEVTTNNIIIFPTNSRGGKDTEIVDKVTNSNTNRFSAESKSSKIPTPDIKAIAKKFFDKMMSLAEEVLVGEDPDATEIFHTHLDSLLTARLSDAQKEGVLKELVRLSEEPNADSAMRPFIDEQLDSLKLLLKAHSGDNLIALHKAPNAQNIPPWSQQIRTLLTETPIVEGDRFMLPDNLADLYQHNLEMFMLHKRDSEPYWDIVDTATFVLDIADEEFRQEQKYDIKQSIELAQSKVPQKEITLNDLTPDSLDSFNKKRLEKEYSTDCGITLKTDSKITLKTDFKEKFIEWIQGNLWDFHDAGLNGGAESIFNALCYSAKAGQALRLAQEKK